MKPTISLEKVAFKYGILTFFGLSIYFLLMKLLGLFQIVELRYLNFFIMVSGILLALQYYKNNSTSGLNYFEGLGLGTLTAMIASVPFSIFIFFYLQIDTDFMLLINEKEDFGKYLNPYIIGFLIAFEGTTSGVMISFGLMQYLKNKYISA